MITRYCSLFLVLCSLFASVDAARADIVVNGKRSSSSSTASSTLHHAVAHKTNTTGTTSSSTDIIFDVFHALNGNITLATNGVFTLPQSSIPYLLEAYFELDNDSGSQQANDTWGAQWVNSSNEIIGTENQQSRWMAGETGDDWYDAVGTPAFATVDASGGSVQVKLRINDADQQIEAFVTYARIYQLPASVGVTVAGYQMKKLTGTTAAAEGGNTTVAHGLQADKIITAVLSIEFSTGENIHEEFTRIAGYQVHYQRNTTHIDVWNHTTNSQNILSKPFEVLVTYEE